MILKLFMIDECGDDCLIKTHTLGDDLDEDYIEVWKDMKTTKAREEYPEAQSFYWENPADIEHAVRLSMLGYADDDEAMFDIYYAEECCEDCKECEYENVCPYSGNCPF